MDKKKQEMQVAVAEMAKGNKSMVIKMLSTAGTGFFYRTTKNPMNTPFKLELRKYDPVVRRHVLFTEGKINK